MPVYGTLLLLVVVWGALSFGAVYPWAYWPLAAACAMLGMAGLWRSGAPILPLPAYAVWLGVIAAGALLQLVPLPHPLLLSASAATDAFLREYSLAYAFDPPARHPISIAPASTRLGLALFTAFALFLIGASRMLSRVDLETLVRRVMLFAVLMGIFGVVQRALHADAAAAERLVYGFWRPSRGGDIFGPFINRNHFAGWMVMAVPLVLGYAAGLFERVRPRQGDGGTWIRWLVAAETGPLILAVLAILSSGTALALTGSRSGLAAFSGAVLVMTAFVVRAAGRGPARLVAAAASVLLVAGVIAWAGVDATARRFATAGGDLEGRFAAWRDTATIVGDFPIFGTGFNTYGYAMLVYQTGDRYSFYREAHNDYLQVLAEGGILLAVPAVLAAAFFAAQVRRRFRAGDDDPMTYWIRAGAVAALAGIAAQSLVDFSLQMPGNAALFVLVAAIAVHRPRRGRRAAGI